MSFKKTMGVALRSKKLSVSLLSILAVITSVHVLDVNLDKDFRSDLVDLIVAAFSDPAVKQSPPGP